MGEPFYKVFIDHFKSPNSFCMRIVTDNQKLAMDGYKNFYAMHSNVVILDLTNMFDDERIKSENIPEQCLIMSMDDLRLDIKMVSGAISYIAMGHLTKCPQSK